MVLRNSHLCPMSKKEIPKGYLPKSKAAKLYKRSTAALDRDLRDAREAQDIDFLSNCSLVTNTGVLSATEVTAEEAAKMMDDGFSPLVCFSISLLEEKYGLRNSSENPDIFVEQNTEPTL